MAEVVACMNECDKEHQNFDFDDMMFMPTRVMSTTSGGTAKAVLPTRRSTRRMKDIPTW
jgi:hypothetical protein